MPLVVLSRGVPTLEFPSNVPRDFGPAFERAWQAEQRRLVTLVPDAKQVIARKSGHYVMIEQPDLVIDAIRNVVDAVRVNKPQGANQWRFREYSNFCVRL